MHPNSFRLLYIDILKGIAILCITLLHFESGFFPAWLNSWIGNFMISAFYFSTGWITGTKKKEITVKDLFYRRLNSLGNPGF